MRGLPVPTAIRSLWARTNGDLLKNNPAGFPSEFEPVWWVGSDTAMPTRPEGFATLSTVGRATSLVVSPVVDAPWELRRVSPDPLDNAGEAMPLPRWVSDPHLARPDGVTSDGWLVPAPIRLTGPEFWAQLLTWCVWWGRGAFMFVPDRSDGQPVAGTLRILDPRQLTVDRQSGYERWRVGGARGPLTDRDGYLVMGSVRWRVVVVHDQPPYGADGTCKGVLERYAGSLMLSAQVEAYARGTFRSGVPAGVLKVSAPNLTQPQADKLRENWLAAHGGDTRSVAVLNATTEFSPLQFSPVDAALVESGQMSRVAVAHAFGMEAHWLDASGDSKTYANLNDRHRQLWAHTQQPRAVRLMALLSALLPAGQELLVDARRITELNPLDWASYVIQLYQAGLMPWQEARDRLGLPRIEQPAEADVPDGGGVVDDPGRRIAETVQKVYLGVGTVLTTEEARQVVNMSGAELVGPGPVEEVA